MSERNGVGVEHQPFTDAELDELPALWGRGITHAWCEQRLLATIRAREAQAVAAWMRDKSYATGHGDSVADLLNELEWQAIERGAKQSPSE